MTDSSSATATPPTATPRKRRRWLAALVTLGLTAAGVGIYAAAANAANVNATLINDAGNSVNVVAVALTSDPGGSPITGTYFCNTTMTFTNRLEIDNGTTLNLIVGDACALTINSGGNGIEVTSPSVLNIFKGAAGFNATVNGTGFVIAKGANGAGIGDRGSWNNGPINIYGGNIYASGYTTDSNTGAPGIGSNGSAGDAVRGAIYIGGDANVYAVGSDWRSGYFAAAGIGTGTYGINSSVAPGKITIATSGMVQAFGGRNQNGTYAPGIGRGTNGITSYQPIINTYDVSAAASGAGAVYTMNWQKFFDTALTRQNVAVGSYVKHQAVPNSGAYLYSATQSGLGGLAKLSGPGPSTTDSSASVYRTYVTNQAGTATYQFQQSTTSTIAASPANQQTRPGNVTVTMTLKNPVGGATLTGVGQTGGAQLYVNGVLTQTANVSSGIATFTITSPPIGVYDYQVKFLGSTYVWASDSNTITGYKVLGLNQAALTLTGVGTNYIYGDGPLTVTVSGGSGTGAYSLETSDPTVASFGTVTGGVGALTLNKAGTYTVTGKRAGDASYNPAALTSLAATVVEATPVVTLTHTGGESTRDTFDLTMQVNKRGSGTAPEGYVQFYYKGNPLGSPVALVPDSNGNSTATLTGTQVEATGSQDVAAKYLGEPGKYTTNNASHSWVVDGTGYCLAPGPLTVQS